MPSADLALSWLEVDEEPQAALYYDSTRFEWTAAARLLAHLEVLIAAAVAEPERPAELLPLLGEAERQQILQEWNDTADVGAASGDVHELFKAQAKLRPDEVAVECRETNLTFRELSRRAGLIARRLRSLGIGPEVLVGVCLDRSPRILEALLGILEAGGAYLPLDPSYPSERLTYILENSRAALLLTERRLAAEPWMGALPRLCIDEEIDGEGEPISGPVADLGNLAYVLYTSGSTGRPKGVQIPRGALASFLRSMQLQPGFGAGETLVSVTTLSFDIAALELFLPLLCGGRVVIASREEAADGARLAELIDRSGAAMIQATPTTWRLLLAGGWNPRRRPRVLCGGEAFPPDLAGRLLPLAEGVWNLYGPTETTVWSSICRIESAERPPSIGRPIRNTRVVVLDREHNPVPIGVPGELWIAGNGLARGYHGRPELTAERFMPDPFGEPGDRLYRTGDLTRLNADGTLEFLGRIDQQVKIRGFRIELGEIEAELARHPEVEAAVAGVCSAAPGEERLVAWYVSPGRPGPTAVELREHLSRRLPEAMVPSAFVRLDALPLTLNGKVDRRALPEPGPERPELPAPFIAPRGELEVRLARLWSEVLGVEGVGAQDGFFDLGGDSIRGSLVVNRLQKDLGEPLYVMPLFEAVTPAAYAGYLRRHYGRAVSRRFPSEAEAVNALGTEAPEAESGPAEVAEMRRLLARRYASAETSPASRLSPAVFILSPPRSGSTLLRVMLAGHPLLFSPPELHLLSWETVTERAAALSGRESFAAEGLVRTVMELEGTDSYAAAERVREMAAQGFSTCDVYRWLQDRIGGRLLVDKTPTYGLDPGALRRAERIFDGAFYLHLTRHPSASVRSYVEARMDQVYGLAFAPAKQAELLWLISHENISELLSAVPRDRWLRVRFEDMVRDPEASMREVCRLVGVDFHPGMLRPYDGNRMTDGLHRASKMMGDPRFSEHRDIDATAADRWRDEPAALSAATWRLAETLGYQNPEKREIDLRPVPLQGEVPLSFSQERLWFLDRLMQGGAAYNVPLDLRLTGELDLTALTASLDEIVRRHEVLRSSFPLLSGQPVQKVAAPAHLPLPCVDLSALPGEKLATQVRRLASKEGQRSFDLERGPLVRAMLLRLDERNHRLLITLHHSVCDGWSRVLLLEELEILYPNLAARRSSPLPLLPMQYSDFAHWQRQWLTGERIDREIRYWRERLRGSPTLAFPSDRPRPAVSSFRGLRRSLTFPSGALGAMKDRARAEGVTLFMLLASAFFTLLQRYSSQLDLLAGAAVAGRNRVELERLIGCFTNTLVLRVELEERVSFRSLLAQVRRVTLEASAHEDLPFEKLVEELLPERDLSRNPLFQAALTLHGAPLPRLDLPGLTVEPLEVDTGTAKLDLTLQLTESQDRLAGFLELSADLFEPDTATRIAGHLTALLAAATDHPERLCADLPFLAGSERQQVLLEWNDTSAAGIEPEVHRQLETHAAKTPGSLAVAGGGLELTYAELGRMANQLARLLRTLGVGPEVPVAVCEERSPELVVAVLAILKAGGFYVPLDPDSPAERLAWLLEDSRAKVMVTRERHLASFQASPVEVICLDRDRDLLAAWDTSDPKVEIDRNNLAYAIYTSGSTGRPKGVAVSHAALANLVAWHRRAYGLAPRDRGSLVAAPAFDASAWEIWPCLASGASLHIPDPQTTASPTALAAWLAARRITAGFLPTPLAEAMVTEPWPPGTRLRALLTGGDRLQRGPAAGLPFTLVNHYGPTENTVVATCCTVTPGTVSPPIGRPIYNVRTYVLDPGFQPLPVGVPGELCLGGEGLARGYLHRPDLTADRFVPDPFNPQPGTRLYRTGDLARFQRDGSLEFLGRLDHQVKIRGFRIELGEVEAVLGQCPGVIQTIVVVSGERPEDRRLVAYASIDSTAPPTAEDLRAFAAARLPAYMVPSAIVFLNALPLTPHGKIDRGALPPPPVGDGSEMVLPRNAVEEVVAGIWGEILGAGPIGIHQSFFALGGHSLKAAQVISRLRGILRLELPTRLLFEEPTVARFSGRLLADPKTKTRIEKAARLWLRLADFSKEQMEQMLQERETLR